MRKGSPQRTGRVYEQREDSRGRGTGNCICPTLIDMRSGVEGGGTRGSGFLSTNLITTATQLYGRHTHTHIASEREREIERGERGRDRHTKGGVAGERGRGRRVRE